MSKNEEKSLKERINEEMTVNYANALEKNFDLAKQFVRITREGKVDVRNKDKLTGTENISLYLIGKLYAKEAGLASTETVGNKELTQELGIKMGSLLPWLKSLRDSNVITVVRTGKTVEHTIKVNLVEQILKDIRNKLGEQEVMQNG